MQFRQVFRSLANRNFALFFTGQLLSRIGMWMQRTAVVWVVYSITHSAFMIGVATFAELFPSFIFSIRGGIIADKHDRFKVLLITQALSALQAVVLTIFAFMGNYNIPLILGLSVFLGIVNAYDVPVRQSMINEIIENKDDLPNAVALNSSLNNLARLAGPALAGFVLAKFGADYCFLSNAVSFVAVIGALLLMKLPAEISGSHLHKSKGNFKEAIHYLSENKNLGMMILIAALSSFLVFPYVTLLPVYAKVIFKGNAATYGWLNAAVGTGALAGSFYLASLPGGTNFRKVLLANTFLVGISLLLFAYITNLYLGLLFVTIGGFGTILQGSVIMTIVQRDTAAKFRGRIISIMAMAIFGMLPLGSLLVGYVAPILGTANTICIEGILAVIITVVFYKYLLQKQQAQFFNH
jgi:MFS family permease